MSDRQIIEALIARDERVTKQFFFENCRPLFLSIIGYVFSYEVDFDEFVNELYLHLMEDDAYRLRQFQGRSSIYQWMKVTAIRYFIAKRCNMIETTSKEPLMEKSTQRKAVDNEDKIMAMMDVEYLFSLMSNRRYVYVIRRLVLQEANPKVVAQELRIKVDNLYNIKKRAIASLTEIALKEVEKYEKETNK